MCESREDRPGKEVLTDFTNLFERLHETIDKIEKDAEDKSKEYEKYKKTMDEDLTKAFKEMKSRIIELEKNAGIFKGEEEDE